MDFKKILLLLFLFLFLDSCSDDNLKSISTNLGINIDDISGKYIEKEQWNEFNGDGYRMTVYFVDKQKESSLLNDMKSKGGIFIKRNCNINPLLKGYITSDSVMCLSKDKANETYELVFDNTNLKLYYYHEIR